ncbi:DISARM system phospholipase D-like protein DrmC [Falsiroseomonas selenitidurans]|uniref:Phospholipase D n=1 Tax=Falsiroseomonas selenitidurans TaxID=2716335 RepID=A0ABX1E341_9PROT|nr:DISARM system phospholipase D-like protein DrmC [Falsiroseomonas selenitidurans]NKC31592.1 phospholipase [Falsiroseomonas selenitidurans]
MEELLEAAIDLVALLSPHRIEALANGVRCLRATERERNLDRFVATPTARAALNHLLEQWERTAISGDVLAGILRGAAHARQRTLREATVELVWTGPTTPYAATRRTEQVLLDLIRGAKDNLFLVSFVVYDVSSVVDELNAATQRGVEIRILLESSLNEGGSLSVDPIATMRGCAPSALLYAWVDRQVPFVNGRVHAKVAVSDGRAAFLTSANLTGHALEKNMEAGVLIEGGHVPSKLRSHLHALIDTRIVKLV